MMKSLTAFTGGFEVAIVLEVDEDDEEDDDAITSSSNRLTLIFLVGGPGETE